MDKVRMYVMYAIALTAKYFIVCDGLCRQWLHDLHDLPFCCKKATGYAYVASTQHRIGCCV